MRIAMKTDVGHIRSVNEDRALVKAGTGGVSWGIIADGMGGHQAGDIASQLAVDTISEQLQSVVTPEECDHGDTELAALLREAVFRANEKVYAVASSKKHYHGMGTTVVVALVTDNQLVIGHIGDSRAYQWNGSELRQLTEDHSLVNELLKSGQISAEEANHHPRRNVLTRALGTEPFVEVDVKSFTWQPHDILLLCTDGLSSLVGRDRLQQVLQTTETLDWKAEQLVHFALQAGGDDNVTVLLLANESEEREVEQS